MATTEPHADTRPLLHHSTGRDLLPGVVAEASLPYFQQFLRREVMRHTAADASDDDAAGETEAD
ncbi:hypothetical protein MINTM007_10370 [Mycobacterium intracellulare]|nr:hypothetical protein MINTM007_10370 [Mycobacterium intracellulare]